MHNVFRAGSDYTKKMKAIGGMRSSCNHFPASLLCKQT